MGPDLGGFFVGAVVVGVWVLFWGRGRGALHRHAVERLDQVAVGSLRLAMGLFEDIEDFLDAVDRRQNDGDRFAGHGHAVAKFAHQRFRRMRERGKTRQAEKSACPFDGVDEPEDVVENLGVVWILLEPHKLDIDHVEAFVGFGQEFPEQIIHAKCLLRRRRAPAMHEHGLWLVTV